MSKDDKDKVQIIDKDLDLSNAGRGVWLVKVPKYIAQKWEKAPSNMDVGKLRISKTPGQKAQVSLSLTPAVLALDPDEKNTHRACPGCVTGHETDIRGILAHGAG